MSAAEGEIRSTILKRDTAGVVRNGAEWLTLWSDPDALKTHDERRADAGEQTFRAMVARQLAAAARSVSGDSALQVEVGERGGAAGDLRVGLGELSAENLPALRGRLDTTALFLRLHDPALHAAGASGTPNDQRFADLLEAVRCEALGARLFPGIEANIMAFHQDRLERADLLGAHLASLVPLAEALRMVVRDTLLGYGEPSVATSGFWMWDRWLRERVGAQLGAIPGTEADQARFAAAGKLLMEAIFAALESRAEPATRMAPARRPGTGGETPDDDEGTGTDSEAGHNAPEQAPGDQLFGDDAAELPIEWLHANAARRPPPYLPYTTQNDRIIKAESLGDPARLRQRRQELDQKRGDYRRDFARLVAHLQRRLMAKQSRNWSFDLEEGLIDASRLDRVVVNPGFADAYKQEEETVFRDTAVTLLIDNSGSMRGKPIEIACVVADLVAAALEQCQVSVEVLGFTTSAWRGGKSAQSWAKAGKPTNPGRLNDLLHVVYKDADEPLRRARNNLVAMLDSDLLKENVDGEALQWAARRLLTRGEQRRVLIVISDGAPVDQSTLESNDDTQILDRHLREVIATIERGGQIELAAIGIKHGVKDYYRRAVRIEKVEELGARVIDMLDQLVAR